MERANNPSYGWRSISAAKQVLKQGLRKRIGNGHDTKVWEEPWLQTDPPRPPRSARALRDDDIHVHHLINPERHEWDLDMLNEMIATEDIPRITEIRVSRIGRQDCYSWDFTKSGLYTVRSGYTVARNIRTAAQTNMVSEPSTMGLKKEIWKIKAPRKLKHFLWQATSGYIATAKQLKDRHCSRDSVCMRCGAETESINHTLFECPPALQVWALSLVPTPPGRFPCTSIYGNIDYLLLRAKKLGINAAVLAPVPWILWYIWKSRNEKVFSNKDIDPLDTLQLAIKEAESWTLAQKIPPPEDFMQTEPQATIRTSPSTNAIQWRCQTDASWISSNERTGLCFTLLKADSAVLFGTHGLASTASPLHAEAEGVIWAMQEVLKTGNRDVQFELDCEQLVKLICKEEDWPSMAAELDEIKALSMEYTDISFIHIPRSSNVHADRLAKGGRSRVHHTPYVDCVAPSWLASQASLSNAA